MAKEHTSCTDSDSAFTAWNYETTTTSRIEWLFVFNASADASTLNIEWTNPTDEAMKQEEDSKLTEEQKKAEDKRVEELAQRGVHWSGWPKEWTTDFPKVRVTEWPRERKMKNAKKQELDGTVVETEEMVPWHAPEPDWPKNKKPPEPRKPRSFTDFEQDFKRINNELAAVKCKPLEKWEFIAARLYTGPMFVK